MHAKKRNAKKVQQQLVVMIAAARIRKLKMFEACDFQPGDITSSHNLVAFLFVFFFCSPPDSTLHTSTGNASGATNKSSKRANSSTIRGIIAVVAANQNYSQAGAAIIRHN